MVIYYGGNRKLIRHLKKIPSHSQVHYVSLLHVKDYILDMFSDIFTYNIAGKWQLHPKNPRMTSIHHGF